MRAGSLVVCSLVVAACAAPSRDAHVSKRSSPIVGGATDAGHPAVVLLYNSDIGSLCTGTLITPTVVLTAAHCTVTDESCVGSACTALAASGFQVAGGTRPFNSASFVLGVSEVHFDPHYDGANFTGGDLGILVLDSPAPVDPIPVLHASASADAVFADGSTFVAVGYGLANAPSGPDSTGTKRSVTLMITQHDAVEFDYGGNGKNTCNGDSGGPALAMVDGVETVIGTTSYGDDNCTQFGADERTDREDDFVSTYAPAAMPSPSPTSTATPAGTGTPIATPTPGDGNDGGNGHSISASPGSATHGCDVSDGAGGAIGGVLTLLAAALASRLKKRV